MAVVFIDLVSGNDANDGTTWALAKKTLPVAGGNEIRVAKSGDPVDSGIDATFTYKSGDVVLDSVLTKTIEAAAGNTWTSSANITGGSYTTWKKYGAGLQQFAVAAGFTTGKVAYKAITSANFSGYNKITLWLSVSAVAAYNSSQFRLCLCDDAIGNSVVNSIPLPTNLLVANAPTPIVVDYGGALGSAITSVALYLDSDAGAVTVRINNIEACGDFNLKTLFGNSNVVGAQWYAPQYIYGTTVRIDQGDQYATINKGYDKDTNHSDFYYRETIPYYLATNPMNTITANNQYLFGWNKVSGLRDGETWLDGYDYSTSVTVFQVTSFTVAVTFKYLGFARFARAIGMGGITTLDTVQATACCGTSSIIDLTKGTADNINIHNNTSSTYGAFTVRGSCTVTNLIVNSNNGMYGTVLITGCNGIYDTIELRNNYTKNLVIQGASSGSAPMGSKNIFKNVITKDSDLSSLDCCGCDNIFDTCDFSADSAKNIYLSYPRNRFINCPDMISYVHIFCDIYECRYGGDENAFRHWLWESATARSYVEYQTVIKHGTDLGAWKYNVQGALFYVNDVLPIAFRVAEIAVQGGVEVTIKIWAYGNTGAASNKLMVRPYISQVVDAEQYVNMFEVEEWRQLEITFTPTRDGIAVLEYLHLSANNDCYIGSIEVT